MHPSEAADLKVFECGYALRDKNAAMSLKRDALLEDVCFLSSAALPKTFISEAFFNVAVASSSQVLLIA